MKEIALVLDVESVGLQGEGFAYGLVVVDLTTGQELDRDMAWCDPDHASGTDEGRAWIALNVMPGLYADKRHVPPCASPHSVRDAFWAKWQQWAGPAHGATLWADCGWPVEARFLARCVDDKPVERTWQGPYPLHEIATAILLAGGDPLARTPRLADELPEHNPLADARQSARQLFGLRRTLRTQADAARLYWREA